MREFSFENYTLVILNNLELFMNSYLYNKNREEIDRFICVLLFPTEFYYYNRLLTLNQDRCLRCSNTFIHCHWDLWHLPFCFLLHYRKTIFLPEKCINSIKHISTSYINHICLCTTVSLSILKLSLCLVSEIFIMWKNNNCCNVWGNPISERSDTK